MAYNSLSKFHSFDNHRVLIPETLSLGCFPRICVICMASYNVGILFGQWIDASQDTEIINNDINNMLSRSPVQDATEWAIYAYDGFSSLTLNKSEGLELIHQKAIFIKYYGEWSAGLLDYFGDDVELAEEAIVDHYHGAFDNHLCFAEVLFDKECGHRIPEHLKLYINFELFKNDIFRHDYYAIEGDKSCHIFSVMRESNSRNTD